MSAGWCRAGRLVGVEGEECGGGHEAVVVWDSFGRVAEGCVLHAARLVGDLRRRGRPGVQARGGPAHVAEVERLLAGRRA